MSNPVSVHFNFLESEMILSSNLMHGQLEKMMIVIGVSKSKSRLKKLLI